MIPAHFADEPDGLVILDWSGWIHAAWHRSGPEGMAKDVAAQLFELLSSPTPPRLVRAVDAAAPTHRHALTEHLDPQRRYKAHRTKKPWDFYAISQRLDALVDELQIPTLWPADFGEQTWEADDAAATACARARGAGLPVLLLSRDKDWRQLVTDEGPRVLWWDGHEKVLDARGVVAEHGVSPEMLADWLALVGDTSDNVPGCDGLGPKGATTLLRAWSGIEALLAEAPLAAEQLTALAAELKVARRLRDNAKKKFAPFEALEADAKAKAEQLELWKLHAHAHAHTKRADVELSRRLVELRRDVPIDLDLAAACVGGWNVIRIRRALEDLGCGWLGRDLVAKPKRARSDGERARAADQGHGAGAAGARSPRGGEGADRRDPHGDGHAAGAAPVEHHDPRHGAWDAPSRGSRMEATPGSAAGPDRTVDDQAAAASNPAAGAQPARQAPATPAARPAPSPERDTGEGAADSGAEHERFAAWVGAALAAIASGEPWPKPTAAAADPEIRRAVTETALALCSLDRSQTPLGRAYAVEDLLDKKRVPTCHPAIRAAVIEELKRRGVADLGRKRWRARAEDHGDG